MHAIVLSADTSLAQEQSIATFPPVTTTKKIQGGLSWALVMSLAPIRCARSTCLKDAHSLRSMLVVVVILQYLVWSVAKSEVCVTVIVCGS